MMKPKHQRLVLRRRRDRRRARRGPARHVGAARTSAAYFYTPADIAAGKAGARTGDAARRNGRERLGQARRRRCNHPLHGRGRRGARRRSSYRGILPDLFREGSGVVAEGKLAPDETFVADNILAKHDERYMPPQLGNQAAEHKAGQTLKR